MTTLKEQFPAALAKIERVFPAPRTLGRALLLLRDAQSDLGDIAALIGCDPALTADVLRCANSVFYGPSLRVSAIDHAVQRIGFRETLRLLSLVVANATAGHDLGSYGIAAEDSWAESLFSGICLEHLARAASGLDPDEAYVAGLLRFIGRLAINQTIADLGGGLFWDGQARLAEWETENVGVTQAAAGAMLLKKWQVSESIALAVENQDAADAATLPSPLAQAMHFLARILPPGRDLAVLLKLGESPLSIPEDHPFAREHRISAEDVARILADSLRIFTAIRDELYR